MPRLSRVYYSKFHKPKPARVEMSLDEIRKFRVDFNGGLESESVNTAAWETNDDAVLTISAPTIDSGVAVCVVEAALEGTAQLSCIATLDSGRKLKQWFQVEVRDEADVR